LEGAQVYAKAQIRTTQPKPQPKPESSTFSYSESSIFTIFQPCDFAHTESIEIGPGGHKSVNILMPQYPMKSRTQNGFSLIEVMIAMLILAVGAGALALLLLASVQGTVQAQERSMATLQASELAQLIHANPAALGHFILPVGNTQSCQQEMTCSSEEWAASHLQQWQRNLEEAMTQAHGIVCLDTSPLDGDPTDLSCDGSGAAMVKITWQEQSRSNQDKQTHRLVLPLPQP